MSETFLSRMAVTAADQPIQVIVRYADAAAMATVNELAAGETNLDLGQQYELIPAQVVSGTPEALLQLRQSPAVAQIWEDLPVHTMLDVSVPLVRAPQMWNLGFDGEGIKVAVVDTGVDPNHPDFDTRILAVKDFTNPSGTGRDGHGHGTHVASTVLGSGAASAGRYIGVAPEAELLVAKVLADNGSGMTSNVMAGVEWAVQQGAQVINLSLGSSTSCDGSDALSTLCDEAVNQGVVVCVAAGNAGPGARTVGSPGCAHNVITVGATDDNDNVTTFSSRGPTSDGRVKPDVSFPGHLIIAARAQGTSMGSPVDARYTSASGTSMATPHAAGASALLLQAHPGSTPAQIKQRLMETAIDLGLDANTQGSGRGDIIAANDWTAGPPLPPPPPPPEPEPEPEPGGCWPFGDSTSAQSSGSNSTLWIVIGILLVLCICVVCMSSGFIALALANW